MTDTWLPELLTLGSCDGHWTTYCDKVYGGFCLDFILSQPQLYGLWVRCRRDPISEGKEAGFWHCISEGRDEDERTPDLRRCERIRWPRAIIENVDAQSRIEHWSNQRGKDIRRLLWLDEEYLVVVTEKVRKRDGFRYFQLVTAYCTTRQHSKEKLRKERDTAKSSQCRPS